MVDQEGIVFVGTFEEYPKTGADVAKDWIAHHELRRLQVYLPRTVVFSDKVPKG
jgi:hypothetical protein